MLERRANLDDCGILPSVIASEARQSQALLANDEIASSRLQSHAALLAMTG